MTLCRANRTHLRVDRLQMSAQQQFLQQQQQTQDLHKVRSRRRQDTSLSLSAAMLPSDLTRGFLSANAAAAAAAAAAASRGIDMRVRKFILIFGF